jgi:Methyltransferase domain
MDTLLFVPPGHFYSPVPDRQEAAERLRRLEGPPPTAVEGIAMDVGAMHRLWDALVQGMADCDYTEEKRPGRRYYYENEFYSYGDALIFRSMLKHFAPRQLIEIGSGYSSAVALDTRDTFGVPQRMTFIEPYPERLRSLLREQDEARTRILVSRVQEIDLSLFAELQAGDILFIDSSHVVKTGSDLHHILFEVLPRLAGSVILHFHDIFWPFEYPAAWAVDQLRGWNEIYMLRAFLSGHAGYEVLFFNDYYAKLHAATVAASAPLVARNPGGGLWLRKTQG